MTVANLYKFTLAGQKVILKDDKNDCKVVYYGDIDNISSSMLDRKIVWVGTSDVYVGTIEIVIE